MKKNNFSNLLLPSIGIFFLTLVIVFSFCVVSSLKSRADEKSEASEDAYGASALDIDTNDLTTTNQNEKEALDDKVENEADEMKENGEVHDGENGDKAGVIGDEDNQSAEREADKGVQGLTDDKTSGVEESDRTFWGIVAALAIAAGVILLIALLIPKDNGAKTRK